MLTGAVCCSNHISANVHLFVLIKVLLTGKAFLTNVAYIGFFTGVQHFMTNQMASMSKALLTDVTHVGHLSVQLVMINYAALVNKALVTSATHKRFLARV